MFISSDPCEPLSNQHPFLSNLSLVCITTTIGQVYNATLLKSFFILLYIFSIFLVLKYIFSYVHTLNLLPMEKKNRQYLPQFPFFKNCRHPMMIFDSFAWLLAQLIVPFVLCINNIWVSHCIMRLVYFIYLSKKGFNNWFKHRSKHSPSQSKKEEMDYHPSASIYNYPSIVHIVASLPSHLLRKEILHERYHMTVPLWHYLHGCFRIIL
jgi:hypothetical protein